MINVPHEHTEMVDVLKRLSHLEFRVNELSPIGHVDVDLQLSEIPYLIRKRRKHLGMSQLELAECCGIGRTQLANIEGGTIILDA